VTPPGATGAGRDQQLALLLAVYAVAAAATMAVSAQLWLQSPLKLIPFEFDYFLGHFRTGVAQEDARTVDLGRVVHATAFLALGMLYLAAVSRLARRPEGLSTGAIWGWSALVSVQFAAGMPWVSPDVFYYIGTGWLESHYGLSPYAHGVNQVPGFASDEMFNNIFPGFVGGGTSYGPVFSKLAAALAGLSGGNEKLALALHKGLYLGLHGMASWMVWRMAPRPMAKVALLSYAANPLILFSVLTCAHNDHLMNCLVLLALLALWRGRLLACGAALGLAFSVKYFPLVFLPVLMLAAFVGDQRQRSIGRRSAAAAQVLAGFLAVAAAANQLYPAALQQFAHTASAGVGVYRNSIYHFVDLLGIVVLPGLFDMSGTFVLYGDLAQWMRKVYVLVYALVLLAYVRRLAREGVPAAVELCLVVALLYFMLVNASNQEWYLTWLLGFAFVLPHPAAQALGWRLSAYFMPLVIFTVNTQPSAKLYSNAGLYALVLVLGCAFLWHTLRRPVAGTQPHVAAVPGATR
jgi:alpha-1,6-mannosyltransferase